MESSSKEHQEAKKRSTYKNKGPLKDDDVRYCSGYMFEDHPLEGAAEFSLLFESRNEYKDVDFEHPESDDEND